MFEKILCKRLTTFLNGNQILYCHQYGSKTLFSIVLMIIEVTECVKLLLDEKKFCNYVFGIFIDVKKVFDKVDHDI